jgi:hypothetical protein
VVKVPRSYVGWRQERHTGRSACATGAAPMAERAKVVCRARHAVPLLSEKAEAKTATEF